MSVANKAAMFAKKDDEPPKPKPKPRKKKGKKKNKLAGKLAGMNIPMGGMMAGLKGYNIISCNIGVLIMILIDIIEVYHQV